MSRSQNVASVTSWQSGSEQVALSARHLSGAHFPSFASRGQGVKSPQLHKFWQVSGLWEPAGQCIEDHLSLRCHWNWASASDAGCLQTVFPAVPDRYLLQVMTSFFRMSGTSCALTAWRRDAETGPAGWISCSYFKMLTARATTSTPMPRDTIASIIISSLAHRLIAETSVGLNAVAVQKASDR